ncbi:MAG: DUF4271 domain-containing protein [Paludibacter sp.]|nr:DUF4271 domain-containing protein [Paludibacter sp.]
MPLIVSQVSILSSPISEEWFFVVIMLLFLIMVYAFWFSYGWLKDSVWNFFNNKKRNSIFSTASANALKSKTVMVFFTLMVFALYLYVIIHNQNEKFELYGFIKFAIAIVVFYTLKQLIMETIAWIFLDKTQVAILRNNYITIVACTGCVIFPLLITNVYITPIIAPYILAISILICIASFLLYTIKLFQLFYRKLLAFFYILLYLCALEIIPLFLFYKVLLFIV